MMIRLLVKIGVKEVSIAGFDGFAQDVRINYCSEKLVNSILVDKLEDKNRAIAKQISQIRQKIKIHSITKSKYFEWSD